MRQSCDAERERERNYDPLTKTVGWRHVTKSRMTRFFLSSLPFLPHAHLASPCLVSPCFASLLVLSPARKISGQTSPTHSFGRRPTLPILGLPHGPKKAPRVDNERPVSQSVSQSVSQPASQAQRFSVPRNTFGMRGAPGRGG
ncbi:hypothetical protein LY76DRAFT_277696 [Colletotrichum caudatum]|nr:hypothetical protein LY76DRAFT_277696 [Colletotrichum caudatum]